MEYELKGGNMSSVVTDGSVVYKDTQAQSPTIQRLLEHLEAKGITFAPKALGIDEKGRDMLSFVEGDTVDDYPFADKLEDKIAIVAQVAGMLRKLHDATVDFVPMGSDKWFLSYEGVLEKEVACHNDIAPYNVTFKNGLPIGIIDFDVACPAPRIWDIVYAAYRFVPLGMSVYDSELRQYRDYDKARDALERKRLIGVFLQAYGMDVDMDCFCAQLVKRLSALVKLFDDESERGNVAFIQMKKDGHQELYVREVEFIGRCFDDWR